MSPVSSTSLSQVQPQIPPHPASTNPHSHHRIQQSAFPEPIIFQYVLYYPGNLPLVITAGHGGSSQPGEVVTRKKTHRFRRVADLATTTDPIEISSFAEPLFPPSQYDNLAVVANLNSSDETMPKMAPRDQTKGGNFKKDLNTHSIALNLANAISCLTSGGNSGDDASSGSSGAIVGTADGAFTGVGAIPNRLTTAARNDETKDDSIGTNPIPTRSEGDLHAEAAWREYHDLIDHVQKMALQKALASTNYQQKHEQDGNNVRQQSHLKRPQEPAPGRGLLLDIHGHAHATNLIEVGYLLDGVTLNKGDDWLNAYADRLTNETSVRALAKRVVGSLSSAPESDNIGPSNLSHQYRQGIPFSRFIRGGKNESLGGMLQAQGLNAVPSPDFKSPCQECIYFFGGYTIQRHGSRDQKVSDLTSINSNETIAMDAIQLELPKILRLVDKEQGREVGMKLGRAVVDFAAQYYGLFKEGSALLAREQSDAAIMAAMAKYSASRSGANTPRKNGGRLGGRVGHSSASQGGVAGQMLHSTRLHERLARVGHTYSRVLQQQQQQQHHHYHHHPPGTDSSSTSILSDLSHHPSEKCGSHSGDSNQSGDSEMESDRMEPDSVFSSRRPEIKRQTSRL
ncbi:hypothetical protein FBU30_007411 [Linnemannia zychae]|nr:hypothetical protein FBU30_007411 [Linnemannia zychae]